MADKDKSKDSEDGKGSEDKDGKGSEDGKDGKDSKGEGDKSCEGKDSCVAKGAAAALSAPHQKMKNIDQLVKDKIDSILKKIWSSLSDKAEMVSLITKELPNVVPNVINKIGQSSAGAVDNVSNSIKKLFDQVAGQEIKGYPNIFGPFEVGYAMIIIKIQNVINQIALGGDADKILADPNIKSGELLNKMMRTSKRYKDAAQEAEFRNIFGEWFKNYIDALLKTLEIAQPEVDRINGKLSEIIEGMGDNIGKSITHSLVNIISAIVSNIPVVGGVVSALLSADELGQELIRGCAPIVKGAGMMAGVVDGVATQINKTKCKLNDLGKKIEPILSKIAPSQAGGSVRSKKRRERELNHTTRRIRNMLSRFKCKKNGKTNYTRRIIHRR